MKLIKSAVTLTAIILAMTSMTHAYEGTRGGGDNVALEFQQALISAVQDAKDSLQLSKVLTEHSIIETASKAQIVVVDDALDVKIKDIVQNSVAVNIPAEQKILINRQRWNNLKEDHIKRAIALHEVLSLKKLEQTGYYPLSTEYLRIVGLSVSSLKASLQVDRIQQIRATSVDRKAGTVLYNFFAEARESLSIKDIPDEKVIAEKGFQCRVGIVGRDDLRAFKFSKANVYLNESIENGPLFPDQRAWRLKTEGLQKISNASSLWQKITWTESANEFTQTMPPLIPRGGGDGFKGHSITIRKNNGLFTFRVSITTDENGRSINPEHGYGYCFFK